MEIPSNNEDYRAKEYWDKRYQSEDSYEWFSGYATFKQLLEKDVKPSDKILMLGCGNSPVSEEMYKDGHTNITNVDFSPIVIKNMAAKHADLPNMRWVVGDITDLKFEKDSYDVVIEKGTLDALMVHEKDQWNISEATCSQIDCILKQILRVLKPDGKFISITFAQPHFRKPLYACAKYDWSVEVSSFGNSFHFFYFVMDKNRTLSQSDKEAEIKRDRKKKEETIDQSPVFIEEDNDDFLCGFDL